MKLTACRLKILTKNENGWATVAKKKVNKRSKVVLEMRKSKPSLDVFLVRVRVLNKCYLGAVCLSRGLAHEMHAD